MSNSQFSGVGGGGATSPYADLHKTLLSSFPRNLLQLKLNLDGHFAGDLYTPEDPDQPPFTNLQNCIEAQTQLQEVYFGFTSFPVKWIKDAFTSLANSCAPTLRYLELQGYPGPGHGIIDLKMLSVCQSLEVLHLPSWGRTEMTFRNVEKLPTSLKRLVICEGEGGCTQVEDPNVFKRLVALEWLSIFGVNFPSAPKYRNQEAKLQFYRTMIQGLLSLRKLEGFHLEGLGIALNRYRSTVKMLRPFDANMNPADRYPHTEISFNLKWRWYDGRSPPWSYRPFDKEAMAKPRQLTGIVKAVEEMDESEEGKKSNGVDTDADKKEDLEGKVEEDGNLSDVDDEDFL